MCVLVNIIKREKMEGGDGRRETMRLMTCRTEAANVQAVMYLWILELFVPLHHECEGAKL